MYVCVEIRGYDMMLGYARLEVRCYMLIAISVVSCVVSYERIAKSYTVVIYLSGGWWLGVG